MMVLVVMVVAVLVVMGSDGSHDDDDGGWVWCYGSETMMVGVGSDGECMVVQVWVVVGGCGSYMMIVMVDVGCEGGWW